ncbi:hypothetical protein EVAR_5883_1 [Eumeta japonica]|uniref:Uncharacterized protein n=1 Tax=Eumeta variegata TaxID=151549 RepID=A0A4C1TF59_EUMVA|nr:hypothetical protein EVAR_5883_1 [Eumeta japonica]
MGWSICKLPVVSVLLLERRVHCRVAPACVDFMFRNSIRRQTNQVYNGAGAGPAPARPPRPTQTNVTAVPACSSLIYPTYDVDRGRPGPAASGVTCANYTNNSGSSRPKEISYLI